MMLTKRAGRNDLCPCGSGQKYKHCCLRGSFSGEVSRSEPVPTDIDSASHSAETSNPVPRVGVDYVIDDVWGKAEVSFSYPLGTRIIMADGRVLPVEWLEPAMRFRLEDGGIATVASVEEPRVREPAPQEKDEHGNSLRRVIGTVKYTGYFPRFDISVAGETLETTPGHLFWSVTRDSWQPAETFRAGELLRNRLGNPVPVESISQVRMEFCELYNVEVEGFHTYFVGNGSHGGIWTHNGIEMGCRVPRAAVAEALDDRAISRTSKYRAGVAKPPDHHLFPQELRDEFAARGFHDIDSFLVRLDEGVHQALHYRQASDVLDGGFWNNEFLRRMDTLEAVQGQLNRRQILRIGAQMRRDYIPGIKLLRE